MMRALENLNEPSVVKDISSETAEAGFQMVSEPLTGALLRTLAASKPAGNLLEIGTGTGVSTAWLLSGMDERSRLVTVENDNAVVAIAQKHLGHDRRLVFRVEDAETFLERNEEEHQFDLIFADTWAGKYLQLDAALDALKIGGFYIIDDMLPQANWPEGHDVKVAELITVLEGRQDLLLTPLNWASGIIIATKVASTEY